MNTDASVIVPVAEMRAAAADRALIEGKSIPVPDAGCWLWLGRANGDGYGQVTRNGHSTGAHRVSYAAYRGEIPPGLLICHKCDTPACVNPDHLFAATHRDNMRDKGNKGRNLTTAILTPSLARAIYGDDRPRLVVADAYGISPQVVSDIRLGRTWTHATGQSPLPPLTTPSSHPGVDWDKRNRVWRARFKRNGKARHVGVFGSKDEAIAALAAAKSLQAPAP